MFDMITKMKNKTYDKYKNIESCQKLIEYNNFHLSYMQMAIYEEFLTFFDYNNVNINIINSLLKKDLLYWVEEFLTSDISFIVKKDIVNDAIDYFIKTKENEIVSFLSKRIYNPLLRTDVKKINESKNKIFNKLLEDKIFIKKMNMYFEEAELYYLKKIKQGEIFDFNFLYSIVNSNDKDIDKLTISSTATLARKYGNTNSFKEFYDDENYTKVPKIIRNNNDIAIIKWLPICEIEKFIRFNNFEMNDELVFIISKKISELILQKIKNKDYDICDINQYRDNICNAIIRKSKNKYDNKQNLKYVKKIYRRTDYEEIIKNSFNEKQALICKRKEMTQLLGNLYSELYEVVHDFSKTKKRKNSC